MNILIVDDNADDRAMLRQVLEVHGHDVAEAVNGREGLRIASVEPPDLIISDVLMPVMDGFQFLRNLKQSCTVPFVFYSAIYDRNRDRQLAASLGADGYLVKPLDPVELMAEIDRILSARSTTSSVRLEDDVEYLKRYGQVVASKLEAKVRELEQTLAERSRMEDERLRAAEQLREKQERLNAMTLELSLAEERERRAIAAELHDQIGQDLTLARIKLGVLAKNPESGHAARLLDEAREILDSIIHDVRALTHRISPPILDSGSLEAALKWLGRQIEAEYGLQVEFFSDMKEKPLSEQLRAVIYHAVRELLINTVKHARAMAVRVTVERQDDSLLVAVADDGIGFDPAALNDNRTIGDGFGLFNVRRRICHLGGTFAVESSIGNGTRVTIGMPLSTNLKNIPQGDNL